MPAFLELAPEFQQPWHYWALAFLASFMIGISKSGLKGIAIVIVTIMALVFGGKASTGIIVPMLIVGDIFAITYYRGHVQWKYLFKLIPWMLLGIGIGSVIGESLPEALFGKGLAGIILLSVGMMIWWDIKKQVRVPEHWGFAGIMGLLAGITTMIGNLAGAFSNIFFLSMRLPKNQFIGTAAWLFFITNLLKAPIHIFYWHTITLDTLSVNLRLIPFELLGLFLGVKLVKIIHEKRYRQFILFATAIGAVVIILRS